MKKLPKGVRIAKTLQKHKFRSKAEMQGNLKQIFTSNKFVTNKY